MASLRVKDGVYSGIGAGFPNGHWFKDKWYNNPIDLLRGFRWRPIEELK